MRPSRGFCAAGKRTSWPTLFCWGIYIAVCVLGIYWFLFPAATARLLLENAVSAALPGGVAVHAGAARPTFPPGALFHTLALKQDSENGRIIFQADDLSFSFAAPLPQHTRPLANFTAGAYGGRITGVVAAGNGRNPAYLPACTFTDIDLGAWWQAASGSSLSAGGMASGWIKTDPGTGSAPRTASFAITIKNGALPIALPFFHRPAIHFSELVTSGTIAASVVTVTRLTVRTDDFLTELSGAIRLTVPWRQSVLSLSGTLTGSPQGQERGTKPQDFAADSFAKNGIPIIIDGTYDAPGFSLKGHGN